MATTVPPDIVPVHRALLSVTDKSGLIELAGTLTARNVALVASGGTRTALLSAGLPVMEVAEYTGQPEILGGRVKTLHPKIHGGILARRNLPGDLETLIAAGIDLIDLVVVNLYPFEQTIANPASTFEDALDNIDIGGPSLIRGAAKNHAHVAVVTSPTQYELLLKELELHGGTTADFRRALALAAFSQTARYDAAIAAYLEQTAAAGRGVTFPPVLFGRFLRERTLRYGENPHQQAAYLRRAGGKSTQSLHGVGPARQGALL